MKGTFYTSMNPNDPCKCSQLVSVTCMHGLQEIIKSFLKIAPVTNAQIVMTKHVQNLIIIHPIFSA